MDVKQYFRKVREIESALQDEYPVVVSVETADGGKAGLISEVNRANAAKLIAEGRASLATEEQIQSLRKTQAEAFKAAQLSERARQLQVTFVSGAELQSQLADRKPRSGK